MLGPTKNFPRGKLNAQDEGELRVAIATEGDTVKIVFGGPVAWFALPKAQALAFGELILRRAREIPDDHVTKQ